MWVDVKEWLQVFIVFVMGFVAAAACAGVIVAGVAWFTGVGCN